MNDTPTLAPIPFVFLCAAVFAWGGWYHLFRTQAICAKMAAGAKWVPFLAKAYSGRSAYIMYKAVGVICFLASFFILYIGVRRLLAR